MFYHPCTEEGQCCIQTPSTGLRHPSLTAIEVICSRTTSRRSLQLIVRPTADCHDWLYDQSQIATAGCTTNHSSVRVAFGCTTSHSSLLVARSLGRHFFSTACSVRKLKEYRYWRLTERLFICEGRPVVRLCNWSWPVATGRPTSRDVRPLAWTIVRPIWPRPIVDRYDWWHDWSYDHIRPVGYLHWFDLESPSPSFEHDRRPCCD